MMNKMKKKLFLMAVFALIVTMFVIADTYGLFETNAVALKNLDIGLWQILVNDVDVAVNETISLSDFNYSVSQHTDSGFRSGDGLLV